MHKPEDVFRDVLADTDDPIAAIKAIRTQFGLNLAQAKEIWVRVQGYNSLSELEEKLVAPLEFAFRESER